LLAEQASNTKLVRYMVVIPVDLPQLTVADSTSSALGAENLFLHRCGKTILLLLEAIELARSAVAFPGAVVTKMRRP
jgi:hypothetical protein